MKHSLPLLLASCLLCACAGTDSPQSGPASSPDVPLSLDSSAPEGSSPAEGTSEAESPSEEESVSSSDAVDSNDSTAEESISSADEGSSGETSVSSAEGSSQEESVDSGSDSTEASMDVSSAEEDSSEASSQDSSQSEEDSSEGSSEDSSMQSSEDGSAEDSSMDSSEASSEESSTEDSSSEESSADSSSSSAEDSSMDSSDASSEESSSEESSSDASSSEESSSEASSSEDSSAEDSSEQSSDESSAEETSSEDSSSEPDEERFAIHYGSDKGYKAVGEATDGKYGDVISFTIDASAALSNYELDSVTVHAGSPTGTTVRVRKTGEVYTFTMPENEAYIVLTTTAYYNVSFSDAEGITLSLDNPEGRYKVGAKVTVSYVLDDDYLFLGGYYMKLYGDVQERVDLNFDEGKATFYMPQIDVAIFVMTEPKPAPEDDTSDPFIDHKTTYKGSIPISYGGTPYDLEVIITFNGDGTLDSAWNVYYDDSNDDWGDWWVQEPGGLVGPSQATISNVRSDSKKKIAYQIDVANRRVSFVNPTRKETIELSYASATVDDNRIPASFTVVKAYNDGYAEKAKGMTITKQ